VHPSLLPHTRLALLGAPYIYDISRLRVNLHSFSSLADQHTHTHVSIT
jgi:hypothetical protein